MEGKINNPDTMGKRFTGTEIWEEDWFLDMPKDYKLFWYYMLAKCDHAGLFKVNLRSFCSLNEATIEAELALGYFNKNKVRIRIINNNYWLVEDFFSYQYGNTLNTSNRVHQSVLDLYEKNGVELTSIRGIDEVKHGVKDIDKDKDKDKISLNVPFDDFWFSYDKKVGEKDKLAKKWASLTNDERISAMKHIPLYKAAQPDKTYRKHPGTYLNNKSWNDELIYAKPTVNGTHQQQPVKSNPRTAGVSKLLGQLKDDIAAGGSGSGQS